MKLPGLGEFTWPDITWRDVGNRARLLLIGIPVFIWTMIPIYHMFVFAISPKEGRLLRQAVAGSSDAGIISRSCFTSSTISCAISGCSSAIRPYRRRVGALTLVIATAAAFSISRLRVPGGRIVMNLALFTYFIPAAFFGRADVSHHGHLRPAQQSLALILAM